VLAFVHEQKVIHRDVRPANDLASGLRLRLALRLGNAANGETILSFLEKLTHYNPSDRFPNAILALKALENPSTQTRPVAPQQILATQTTFIPKTQPLQPSFSPMLPHL